MIRIGTFALLLWGCVLAADNNFSQRLEVKNGAFTLDRAGWVFVRSDGTGGAEVGGKKFMLDGGEGFVELPAGTFDLKKVPGKSVVVRRVGELIFYKFAGAFDRSENKPYDLSTKRANGRDAMYLYNWPWLRKNILGNFNTVATFLENPAIDLWRAEGRKTVIEGALLAAKGIAAAEKEWRRKITDYPQSGILIDEFIIPVPKDSPNSAEFGYTHPGIGFDRATLGVIEGIGRELAGRGQRIYPWLGIPWRCHGRDSKPLFDAVKKADGRIVWEAYSFSRDYRHELTNRFARRGREFLEADRDAMRYMIVAPSTMEFSDKNAAVDFKVFLDKQFHLMANDPSFRNVAGLSFWTSTSTKPEVLRYLAALVRHYCILGEKTMLSERCGLTIEPGILANPEWTDGVNHWQSASAVPGSIKTVARAEWPELGFKPGYFPKAPAAMLAMTHVGGKVNRISQELKNLKSGKRYALTAVVSCVRSNKGLERFAVDFDLTNCRIEDVVLRPMFDYTSGKHTNLLCWNNYEIIFRHTGPKPAVLTVSDTVGKGAGPGAGAGVVQAQQLLIDGIRIAPYFE